MFEQVLVPTDGAETTERAIRQGVALAAELDASVHAFAVADTPGEHQRDRLRADPEAEARAAVEDVAAVADREDVAVTQAVREGVAEDEILDYVREADVDLVVMGHHDRTGLGRVFDASVSEAVLERSPAPVVTVRVGSDDAAR